MRFERASVGLVVGSLFAIGCGSDATGPVESVAVPAWARHAVTVLPAT